MTVFQKGYIQTLEEVEMFIKLIIFSLLADLREGGICKDKIYFSKYKWCKGQRYNGQSQE